MQNGLYVLNTAPVMVNITECGIFLIDFSHSNLACVCY